MVWFVALIQLVAGVAVLWGLGALIVHLIDGALNRWVERLRTADPERYANFVMLQESRKGR